MTITMVKIRARITVGSTLVVSTPYIQRFSVNKNRGNPATFDASLKVSNTEVAGNIVGDNVKIEATGAATVGENPPLKTVFVGYIKQVKVNPCLEDPSFVILGLSGVDMLGFLEGKKYTRRCRATRSTFVTINGVQRRGLKSGKFAYNKEPVLETHGGDIDRFDKHVQTKDIATPITQRAKRDHTKQGVQLKTTVIQSGST